MESSLRERWQEIEQMEDGDDMDKIYMNLKTQWFSDASDFLIGLPKNSHCWCQHSEVTGPLLEPFYRYFKIKEEDARIKKLWRRMSSELRKCTWCIRMYYEQKAIYKLEFVETVVDPILAILQVLDKQRVATSMQEIMQNKVAHVQDELMAVLYELFSYHELLEDPQINSVMVSFLQQIMISHDLELSYQPYPGLYALLFHCNQDVRRVALKLVKGLPPFSNADELEPIQVVLEKRMKYLESQLENKVIGMTKESLWLGMRTILSFIKPPAIEEGIVERYPAFISTVLNHVSENSKVFFDALSCLGLLLEALGYNLWQKCAFSPAVLRNTLLSQCFHAKDERTHKAIFDVFLHFLQSLESMQDGQYERQRRYLLYFFLHQVPHSNNFSSLTRKNASSTACSILIRSYKMDPPSPPFECAHFWGPMVVSSIMNTGLQLPFRERAIELLELLLVADATALSILYYKAGGGKELCIDEGEEETLVNTGFPWGSYIQQIEVECENWCCIPLVWSGVLENTSVVPSSSLIRAFLLALSRLSIIDEKRNGIFSEKVAAALHWETPKGCDDGGDGKGCSNAVRANGSQLPELISIFRSCAESFTKKIREQGLFADWPWDPMMAESLLLLQMDSSPDFRKLGKEVLQQFAKDGRLDYGIQFLFESQSSVIKGFAHAVKLLSVKPFKQCNSLRQVFFIASKFLNAGQAWSFQKNFGQKLSRILWPLLVESIIHGKESITATGYESCCVGMFELLPVVFKYTIPSTENDRKQLDGFWKVDQEADCPVWFPELAKWVHTSSNTIRRKWNDAILSILEDLARGPISAKARCSKTVDNLLQPESLLDNDQRQRLLLLFSSEPSRVEELKIRSPSFSSVSAHQPLGLNDKKEGEVEIVEPEYTRRPVVIEPETQFKRDVIQPLRDTGKEDTQRVVELAAQIRQQQEATRGVEIRQEQTASKVEIPRKQHKRPSVRKIGKSTLDAYFTGTQTAATPKHVEKPSSRPVEKPKAGTPRHVEKPVVEHASKQPVTEKTVEIRREEERPLVKEPVVARDPVGKSNQTGENTEDLLKELVSEDADSFEAALDNARRQRIAQLTSATSLLSKRTVIKLDMPGDMMLPKGSVSTRRNKFRVAQRPPPPKMDDWLMRILSFDFFMDGEDTGGATHELVKVPMTFTSPEHYMEVFRPLLIEEFKAQLQRSREEVDVEDKEKVGMVSLISMERVDDMHTARFLSEAGKDGPSRSCVENDLLLISRHPFQESRSGVHLLGKVERRERENKGGGTIIYVKIYLSPKSERLCKAKRLLINRSKWHITKLMSITPQLREFQAVSAMAYSPLVEVILSPVTPSRRTPDLSVNLPDGLWKKLKSDYNESQVAAIRASIGDPKGESHQISLVQGPPGTGKTKTIVAIVSALIQMRRGDEEDINNTVEPRRVGYQVAIAQGWQNAHLARQLMQQEQQRTKKSHARVLVCAQSNAAVDELVARLCKNGIYNSSGQFYKPTIVRAGNARSVHADSMPYFIDKLVEKRLQEERGRNTAENMEIDTTDWHAKLEQITEKINEVVRKISEGAEEDAALNAKLVQMEKQRKQYTMEVQKSLQQSKKTIEADKIRMKKMRSEIIREADIVLTTLSGCGGDIYSACMEVDKSSKQCEVLFDAVVIDEAGQALEPATLIPLQLLAGTHGRCVMVGDPKQLPATVLSQAANRLSFERSMFERFQTNGFPVTMLTIQYRMHPEIRRFPSLHFYDDQLVDGSSVLGNNRLAVFHKDKVFRPYAFLDVSQGQEVVRGSLQSIANMEEVEVAVELFKCFQARYPGEIKPGRIGIITPYKRQLCSLKDSFARQFGAKVQSMIEFNTIDGFQGREVDILILSTVRASQQNECKGIGFVSDIRRMNVALTRAKFSLWIIGNAKALSSNRAWVSLLQDATSRGIVFPVLKPYNTFFTTTSLVVTPSVSRDGNAKVTPEVSTKKRAAEQVQENASKKQKVHTQQGLNKQPDRMEVGANAGLNPEVNENCEKHPSRPSGEDQRREREDVCIRRREEDQRRQREQDQSRRREEDQSRRRAVYQSRWREEDQNGRRDEDQNRRRDEEPRRRRRDEDQSRRRDEDQNRRKDDRRWRAEDHSRPRNDSRDRRVKLLDEHRDPQKQTAKVLDGVHKDKQSQLLSQIVDDEPVDRRNQFDIQKHEGSAAIPKQINNRDGRNPDSLQQTNISRQEAPKILDRNAIERKRLEERRKNRDEVNALMGGCLLDTRKKTDVSARRPTVPFRK